VRARAPPRCADQIEACGGYVAPANEAAKAAPESLTRRAAILPPPPSPPSTEVLVAVLAAAPAASSARLAVVSPWFACAINAALPRALEVGGGLLAGGKGGSAARDRTARAG
jgi:hypothetical protein